MCIETHLNIQLHYQAIRYKLNVWLKQSVDKLYLHPDQTTYYQSPFSLEHVGLRPKKAIWLLECESSTKHMQYSHLILVAARLLMECVSGVRQQETEHANLTLNHLYM